VARKRTRRRRQSILWSVAVVASLLVLIFARDISQAAHSDPRALRSENQSFAALSTAIVDEENAVDSSLTALLVRGSQLNRAELASRLTTISDTLRSIPPQAAEIRNPVLRNDLNGKFATWCQLRARAYSSLIAGVAQSLRLPWSSGPSLPERQAVVILRTTTAQWNALTNTLATQPGHVRLASFSDFTGILAIGTLTAQMDAAPRLQLARSIAIAAVSVSPAPFPSSQGTLEIVGTSPLVIGVSVLNGSYAQQPATITATFTASDGRSTVHRASTVLGPRRAFAFGSLAFSLRSGERGTLRIAVTGAPPTPGYQTVRVYQVHVAPTFTPPA